VITTATTMKSRARACAPIIVAALAFASASAPAQIAAPTTAFDGAWVVSVDCPDTKDSHGLVKGYEFTFDVRIAGGLLDGRHGVEGQPASLHLTGEVRDGGVLEIRAQGISNASEYTVGRIAKGTPYSYTMIGQLDGSHGSAKRREVRPCSAQFSRARS
jgi:hypothetical protein